jgi:prepilin-type N-terminal cleavage/methylation domain-containing protein
MPRAVCTASARLLAPSAAGAGHRLQDVASRARPPARAGAPSFGGGRRQATARFTLIELLVVVAIIATLVSCH